MESDDGKGNSEHINKSPEVNREGGKTRDLSPSSSLSSSSSSSALEIDIDEKVTFDGPSANSKFEDNPSPGSVSLDTTKTPEWSMMSESSPEPHMISPGVQTMDHPPGYDPNRIPKSIFSTNASEWSVASNESLFSIQMGNNSFSGDNAILKSGEFPRLDDWNLDTKSRELSSGLPPVMEESGAYSGRVSTADNEDTGNSLSVGAPAGVNMKNHAKMASGEVFHHQPAFVAATNPSDVVKNGSSRRTSMSNPRLSDESGNSGSSFAFPVLVGDGAKSTNSMKVATEKPQLAAQVSKPTPKDEAKSSGTRWFSWSCCWPRCC